MGILEEISTMVKSAQMRLGGTVFAQRRKNAVPNMSSTGGSAVGEPKSQGFGGTAGSGQVNSTAVAQAPATAAAQPAAATSQSAATPAATPQFSFGREAQKFLRPLMNDMKTRPGAYSNEAIQRFNGMKAEFAKQVRDMKANPQKYTEQQQRQLLQDWKNKIHNFRGWQNGDRKVVGNVRPVNPRTADRYNVRNVDFGNGISMRVSNPDPDKSIAYNRRAMQSQNAYNNYSRKNKTDELLNIADFAMDMNPGEYSSRRGRANVSQSQIENMRRNAGRVHIPSSWRKADTSFILSPEEDKAQWDALARERSDQFNRMNARDGVAPEHNFQTWEDYVNWGKKARSQMGKRAPVFKKVRW